MAFILLDPYLSWVWLSLIVGFLPLLSRSGSNYRASLRAGFRVYDAGMVAVLSTHRLALISREDFKIFVFR